MSSDLSIVVIDEWLDRIDTDNIGSCCYGCVHALKVAHPHWLPYDRRFKEEFCLNYTERQDVIP